MNARVLSAHPHYPIDRNDKPLLAVAKICKGLGIELLPAIRNAGNFQTKAGMVLRSIYLSHGEGHLILTLRSIIESDNNAGEIREYTIRAISDLILAHPTWADSGLRWLEAFDKIGLRDLRKEARENRHAVAQRFGLATLIYRELLQTFKPSKSVMISPDDNAIPEDELVYGLDGIADFLGVRLCHVHRLIEQKLIKTFTLPGLSTRCARKSELAAITDGCKAAAAADAARKKIKLAPPKPRASGA